MPNQSDNDIRKEGNADNLPPQQPTHTQRTSATKQSPFQIPPTLKKLFDKFPLLTYPANSLPQRAPRSRDRNILYIFTTPSDITIAAPSFNPSCLKWQTYLHLSGIPFTTVSSTNHASPSGSLPFLIPAKTPSTTIPLTTSTLPRWLSTNSKSPITSRRPSSAETLYTPLLTGPIRLAYLYALYLHPPSFSTTAEPLYINSASASSLVRFGLTPSLRQAALDEILTNSRWSTGGKVDVAQLFKDAEEAFAALETLLGEHDWFAEAVEQRSPNIGLEGQTEHGRGRAEVRLNEKSGGRDGIRQAQDEFAAQGGHQRDSSMSLFEEHDDDPVSTGQTALKSGTATPRVAASLQDGAQRPGMLDAAVFSYTQVILALFSGIEDAEGEAWSPAQRLVQAIEAQRNLVEHKERILRKCYPRYLSSVS